MDLPGSPLPRPGPRRRAFRSGFAAPQFRTNTSRPCPPSTSRSGPSSPRGTSSAARSPTMSSGGAVRHPRHTAVAVRGAAATLRPRRPGPAALTSANSINIATPPADLLLRARMGGAGATAARPLVFSVPWKLRQPHGRPDRPARARNVPRALRGRHQPTPSSGVTRAGGLPPHFRRTISSATAATSGDPAPLRPLHRLLDRSDPRIRDLWRNSRHRGIAPHVPWGCRPGQLQRRAGAQGIVLATAYPAKFAETVEPLIGQALPVPPGIAT